MPVIKYENKKMGAARLLQLAQAQDIIDEYRGLGYSLTLRQLYYQCVSRDMIPNTDKSYKALGNLISDGRMAGILDWDCISDRLRESRTVGFWNSPREILETCAEQFKQDLWADQHFRIEVWVEKDALAEVVTRAAHAWRCPVMVCRGYMSQSAMWEAGYRRFRRQLHAGLKPVVIHLGDHDPSGMDMSRDIQDRLDLFSDGHVEIRRIALNMDQVEQYGPPPNPAKITDSRAADYIGRFGPESWELDALEPSTLDALIQDEIRQYVDHGLWDAALEVEAGHRARLAEIAEDYES